MWAHSDGGGYLLCKGEDLPLVHTTKLGINTEVVLIKGLWGMEGEGRERERSGEKGGEGRGGEGEVMRDSTNLGPPVSPAPSLPAVPGRAVR